MLQPKQVAIVGGSSSFENAPFNDISIDIWAFNNKGSHYPRLNALIDIHEIEEQEQYAGYIEWRESTDVLLYTKENFPFEEIFSLTNHVLLKGKKLQYFTSSIAWAIALAILQERPKIYIYGVELTTTREYKEQRDCFVFWIGFAAGRGIEIEINCAEKIFKHSIYGIKERHG